MRFNEEQNEALIKCCEWYYDTNYDKKNYFTICGYAGTGKTTIVKTLIEVLGLATYNVLFAAYTGKASLILRIKGNMANTIHKSFYNIYYGSNGQYYFRTKNSLSSLIKLIVIDEFSMINDKMINDILSFRIPVIFLGDVGQLPPIIGKNSILEDKSNIDVMLTKVMRQDDSSGILDLATKARNGEDLKLGTYKNCRVLQLKDIKNIKEYDVILCWKNSTRKLMNQAIRNEYGFLKKSKYPLKGEKVIGLKNNYFHQIDYDGIPIFPVNGLPSIILNDYKIDNKTKLIKLDYRPDFIDEDGPFFSTLCHSDYFDTYFEDIEKETIIGSEDDEDDIVHLDYGYCLSVHRSQGSQYKRGLLLDEFKGSSDIYNKFMYTGITRFTTSLDIVKNYER